MKNFKEIKLIEKIPTILFSIFSVLFSMSILKELYTQIEFYFLIVLGIFITAFLIYNEYVKVRELKKLYMRTSYSSFLLTSTLIISISLSSLGIYFWTNKNHKITNEILIEKSKELAILDVKYNQIKYPAFETTKEYDDLINNIDYWKKKSAASLEERNLIRERIDEFQKTLIKKRDQYKISIQNKKQESLLEKESTKNLIENKYLAMSNDKDRNEYISLIFLVMVLITEGLIIMLNRDLSHKEILINQYNNSDFTKEYFLFKLIFETLYLRKKVNSKINIRDFMISNLNQVGVNYYRIGFDKMKIFYNGLHASNVAVITNKLGDAKLLHEKKIAMKKLDDYFNKVNYINSIYN
jgi:hypothetical protein